MANIQHQALKAGEIRLDYIPVDWPLTPLGRNKDPYIAGWQNKPFSTLEIEEEIVSGKCKAIGLLGGPVYNHPYGLVWVDVDGPSVYSLIESLAERPVQDALPDTLTILSGKEGRERKLYRLDREKHKHFARNKYTWQAEGDGEKLEILWRRHQGVLMGLHPDTDGYFTAENQGFEWVSQLPELPEWLLNAIINKNIKQGIPARETTRIVGPSFAINTEISLDRDMKVATEAMWGMPPEAADDYDIWITVGQSLHSLDESLLDEWEEWSKQSEKYKPGECRKRWLSFSKGGGRGIGSLIHVAQENGWTPSQEHKAMNVDDLTLDHVSKLLEELGDEMVFPVESIEETERLDGNALVPALRSNTKKNQKAGKGKDQKPRNISSDLVADILGQMYQGNLRYSQSHGSFFLYQYNSKGLWSQVSDYEMKGDIKNMLEQIKDNSLPSGYSMNLINDVLEQLRISFIFDDWYEGNDYLLFTNGILEVETRNLSRLTGRCT